LCLFGHLEQKAVTARIRASDFYTPDTSHALLIDLLQKWLKVEFKVV
jgi:hypothetical protein